MNFSVLPSRTYVPLRPSSPTTLPVSLSKVAVVTLPSLDANFAMIFMMASVSKTLQAVRNSELRTKKHRTEAISGQ